jgi:hypothetical protein
VFSKIIEDAAWLCSSHRVRRGADMARTRR